MRSHTSTRPRSWHVLVLIGAVIVAALAAAGESRAAYDGDNGRVLVVSNQDSPDYELYSVLPDGSDLKRLTNNSGHESGGSYCPDGRRIVFASGMGGGGIWMMNADGSNPVQLTFRNTDGGAACSPDGTKIGFVRVLDDGNYEVFVMNADGTDARNLSNNPAQDHTPSWSPYGDEIAFVSRGRGGGSDIYIMLANGAEQRPCVVMPSEDTGPDWSPDGTQITFSAESGGNSEIYSVDYSGGECGSPVNLTNHSGWDDSSSWSPDGATIAFRSNRLDGQGDVFLMNPDGGNQRKVYGGSTQELPSDWQALAAAEDIVPVTARVLETLTVRADPAFVEFDRLPVGATAERPIAIRVTSNDPDGYDLSATRTVFDNGELPLGFGLTGEECRPIPTNSGLGIARRVGALSDPAGDVWAGRLCLGPVGFTAAGAHHSLVTFTVVGL
jgi:Tol biopolymer transport system component